MSTFQLYLSLGIQHILDLNAYDHILFIVTLCAVYTFSQWKDILVLITAFTIGHSLTLALATLNFIHVPINLIEFLIPVTIFITALANVLQKSGKVLHKRHIFKYFTAMFFGLIHGLGFSNYLRSLLGQEDNILGPLFSFNVGIEIGQILIVATIMLITWFLVDILHVKRREWVLILSGAGMGVSLIMIIERAGAF
jgi:hypothetical protein